MPAEATMRALTMTFRIQKGTQVSHFHEKCPHWPTEDFYEQERPLWWGNLCEACAKLEFGSFAQVKTNSGSDPEF